MNNIIQNILVIASVATALLFLIKKFFWKAPKQKKACDKDNCGCH